MIEATEFPHLSMKPGAKGVLRVVINETRHFEGALPEPLYVDEVVNGAT